MTDFDVMSAPLDAPRPQNAGGVAILSSGQSYSDFVNSGWGWDGGGLTEQQAMTVSAIYACVNLIGGALAAIPVNLFNRNLKTGERTQIFDDPLWWTLNEQMTPRWSAAVGWEFLASSLLLPGDSFAVIKRDRVNIRGIEPVHPNRVTVLYNSETDRLVYVVMPDPWAIGKNVDVLYLDQDDMIHVPGMGFNGLRGMSPLRFALRNAGAVALATQDYAGRFFKNQSRPDYVLQSPAGAKLNPEDIDRLRTEAGEKNSGPNSHKPMVLTNGMTFQAVTMTPEDSQLILTRNFQIEEIARIYGVPPFMIGHNEKTTSWGSGVEAMGTSFVRYALRQHIHKFEVELNRKLFRSGGKIVQFDTTELERADMSTQFTAFRTALGRAGERPFMSTDEVRAKLNLSKSGEMPINPPATGAAKDAPETA